MKYGDKVYRINGEGNLEVAKFLEESIVEGASLPTWKLRVKGPPGQNTIRCSTTMYVDTEVKAWERYLGECRAALPDAIKHAQQAMEYISYVYGELTKTKAILEGLGHHDDHRPEQAGSE